MVALLISSLVVIGINALAYSEGLIPLPVAMGVNTATCAVAFASIFLLKHKEEHDDDDR